MSLNQYGFYARYSRNKTSLISTKKYVGWHRSRYFFQYGTSFCRALCPASSFPVRLYIIKVNHWIDSGINAGRDGTAAIADVRLLRRHPHTARPLMLGGIWTRCGVWGLLGVLALMSSKQSVSLLWAAVILVSLYSFAGGIAVLPFNRIISETILPEKRSSFFGWRLFFGGFMAMMAGFLVKFVLGSDKILWPKNFGVLFLFSFVTLIIAYTAMSMFKFPSDSPGKSTDTMPSLWQECLKVFKTYPVLKRLIIIELLTSRLALFMPFLTLYATQNRHIPLKWVGCKGR